MFIRIIFEHGEIVEEIDIPRPPLSQQETCNLCFRLCNLIPPRQKKCTVFEFENGAFYEKELIEWAMSDDQFKRWIASWVVGILGY